MPMGFRLNLKWCPSAQHSFSPNSSSSSWSPSFSYKAKEALYDSEKSYISSVVCGCGDTESVGTQTLRTWTPVSTSEALENEFMTGGVQVDDDIQMSTEEKKIFLASIQGIKASHFGLLIKNLDILEETLSDSDAIRLESDILVQLKRLGALNLFHECLSRSLKPSLVELSDTLAGVSEDAKTSASVNPNENKLLIQSVRKKRRKLRRRASGESTKISVLQSCSRFIRKDSKKSVLSLEKNYLKSRSYCWRVAKSEAEMSKGVKLLAELERIRRLLEESGHIVSLSSWAEAAGVENKTLQQQLHFSWCCRDQLLRSTRSMVVYLARNYRGLGVAFEDLIQAGNSGVLQGAERFDHTRGYKFSTYVQYWIRKSMSMLVAQHGRGIRVPVTLSSAIHRIQKARKALRVSHGKFPDDEAIAKYTGLSIAKITSASKCLRVVGSIDQKIGDCESPRFMELTPDRSITSPEEVVIREHMIKDLCKLLNSLEPRERQVLMLRFGIGNHQCRSLEEIGKMLSVSKEWIRKIERTALSKLRTEDSFAKLKHYLFI